MKFISNVFDILFAEFFARIAPIQILIISYFPLVPGKFN